MNESVEKPVAVDAASTPLRAKRSNYPEPFATRVSLREKRPLGDLFGLKNFGVNLTTLPPTGISALRHAHSHQDEFVYVLSGTAVLITDDGESELTAGMCAGFPAGTKNGHHLINRSSEPVTYLEVGDRKPGDSVYYPDDDLEAFLKDGKWHFRRKDGTSY